MQISLIVAMSKNRVIGLDNRLPWRLPADLSHFKELTMGKSIIMGRRTFESIGKPLPGRHNIVVTHHLDYLAPGCDVVHSLADSFALADLSQEVMIIGGAMLYQEALPFAERIYLTLIDHEMIGDTYFPEINPVDWQETERTSYLPDEKNAYPYSFLVLQRIHQKEF